MGSLLFRSEILTRVGVLLVLFSLGSTMSDMDPDREPLVDAAEHASAAARREAGAAKAANRKIRPRKVGMSVCVCVCVCAMACCASPAFSLQQLSLLCTVTTAAVQV